MPKKPTKITIEPVRARAIRGPKKDDPKSWYWRCEYHHDGTSDTLWSGWGTRREVREKITELVAAKGLDLLLEESRVRRGEVTHIATVEHLMRAWYGWWLEDPEAKVTTVRTYKYAAKKVVKRIGSVRVARLDLTTLEKYKRDHIREWVKKKHEEIERVELKLEAARETLEARRGTEREPAAVKLVAKLSARLERLEQRLMKPVLSTIALDLKALNAAWNWARERIQGFPSRKLPIKAVLPTKQEIKEAIDDHRPTVTDFWTVVGNLDGWAKLAVLLLAATGARKTPIATARWEHFNPEARTLQITDSKTGKRKVALPYQTVELLLDMRPEPARGRILAAVTVSTVQSGLREHIRSACAETGVAYFSVHAIRRLVTDLLYSSGSDPSAAAAQLGHSVQIALEHYRRANLDDKKRAVALAGLGAPPEEANVLEFTRRSTPDGRAAS